MLKVIKDDKDIETLQSDLDNLMKWSDKWLLTFNQDKCKVMSIGDHSRKEYRLTNEAGLFIDGNG